MGFEAQTSLRAVGSTSRRPPKAKAPPLNIHIDYSHRGVGPYGPEADSQLPPSDDYLYTDVEYPEVIQPDFFNYKLELSAEVCLDPIHFAFLDHPILKYLSKIPPP
jgi:hypothetical protein